jgi:hypothetical protein
MSNEIANELQPAKLRKDYTTLEAVAFDQATNDAINTSREQAKRHTLSSQVNLYFMMGFAAAFLGSIFFFGRSTFTAANPAIVYIVYGIFILIFGVTTSFYRFHLKEISKYEHFLFGFLRIRMACHDDIQNNVEVKNALTQDAFATEVKVRKEQRIDSPIPGHPTSDIGSAVMNKILDAIDFTAKPKGNQHG